LLQQKNKNKMMATLLLSPFALQKKPRKEGDGNKAIVTFFITLHQKKKKKVTAVLLLSPSLLQHNENKRRRQQHCHHLL